MITNKVFIRHYCRMNRRLGVMMTCMIGATLCFFHHAWADSGQEADRAKAELASPVKPASEVPKPDGQQTHQDDGDVGSFQDIEDQKRILDAARKALALHARTVHESMSLSSNDLDNKQLLNRDATQRLVGIYENMRPRDAAAVFNVMDPHVLVAISAAMNTRKLSAIMAQMSRDRVNMVSQYLVGVRRFHQKGAGVVEENGPGGVLITLPPGTSYSAQQRSSSGSTPFLPSRQ